MSLAPPAASSSGATRKTFATARYGFSRPRPFCVGELDQARLQQHADVEVKMAGIDAEPLRELTVRELPVAFLAEHLEHADAQRMAERLELLRLVEYQRLLHELRPFVCPGAVLHIETRPVKPEAWLQQRDRGLQWFCRRGPNEARRRLGARFLGECAALRHPPSSRRETTKTISRALFSAGEAQRDAIDERLEPGLRRQHSSSLCCSVGAFGNSDATWPSGPRPSSTRSNTVSPSSRS